MTATIVITVIVVYFSFGAAVALMLDPWPSTFGDWVRCVLLWPILAYGLLFGSGR